MYTGWPGHYFCTPYFQGTRMRLFSCLLAEYYFGYLCSVKPLDPIKEEKIIQAVFAITGKHGLGGVNITRISSEAGVGAGTLYTYFKNKEEIIQAAYFNAEYKIAQKMYKGFDISLPVRDSLKQIYLNVVHYRLRHYDQTVFLDQYIQSNYIRIDFPGQVREFKSQHKPLYDLLRKGQRGGVIVKLDHFSLIIFIIGSMRSCSNGIKQGLIPMKKPAIDNGFNMIWKGITV